LVVLPCGGWPEAAVVDPEEISPELARLVEESLGRDDLVNQIVGPGSSKR
jgi:hypothetical protein